MIRFLDGLVLLKELDDISGAKTLSYKLRKQHNESIVTINRTAYIYRYLLDEETQKIVTNLDDYVQVGVLADKISTDRLNIKKRIKLMKANPQLNLFEYLEVAGQYFIKMDAELKYLLTYFQPFSATLIELSKPDIKLKMLGDFRIGFY